MTSSLNKEKVVDFIEKYPHDSSFSLINSNKSLIVKPGNSNSGGNSGEVIPNPTIPKCSVGLAGESGNPKDFNTLLSMWSSSTDRSKLNPIALMRLWASIYRTYEDWVKNIYYAYPSNTSSFNPTRSRVDVTQYNVEFQDSKGNYSKWDKDSKTYTKFTEGYFLNILYNFSNPIDIYNNKISSGDVPFTNTYFDPQATKLKSIGGEVIPSVISGTIYKNELVNKILKLTGSVNNDGQSAFLNNIKTTELGIVSNFYVYKKSDGVKCYPSNFSTSTPMEVIERIAINFPDSNTTPATSYPRFIADKVSTPYSLHTQMEYGPYKLTISFPNPTEVASIFLPGTCRKGQTNAPVPAIDDCFFQNFVIRTSIDGTTYDEELNYKNFYNDNKDTLTTYTSANGSATWMSSSKPNKEYISTDGVNGSNGDFSRSIPSNIKLVTVVKGTNYNNYSNIPNYQIGDVILGNTKTIIPVVRNSDGVTINAELTSFSTTPVGTTLNQNQFSYGSLFTINPYNPNCINNWKLIDPLNSEVIVSGTFNFNVLHKGRYIKKLEVEFGPNNVAAGNTFNLGYCHPFIEGWELKFDSINIGTNNFLSYSQVNFNDSFYSTTNPTNYSLGALTILNPIAQEIFNLKNITDNSLKWRLLPYILPKTNINLRQNIITNPTLKGNFDTFSFTEDYLSNALIDIPTTLSELQDNENTANALGINPVIYWYKIKLSDLLTELINHTKATCLKTWRLTANYSVSNFKDYTNLILQVQPEEQDVRFLPGTVITNNSTKVVNNSIQVYYIAESYIDIDTNKAAGEMWFLSGGGYTSVTLADNILSTLIDQIVGN